ncbi:MAG: DUF507 family protein [Myxococcota bacterium]
MRLYQAKVPQIANEVIARLTKRGAIDVTPENRPEAEQDLVAIMEEYLRRDRALREKVREYMHERSLPYDRYGRVRSRMADRWGHPTKDDVERFLARQFVENFMISRFIEEVYAEDEAIYREVIDILTAHHVDEQAIRDEARAKIKNIKEGTVEYEIALNKAVREVKKRYGLIQERERDRGKGGRGQGGRSR